MWMDSVVGRDSMDSTRCWHTLPSMWRFVVPNVTDWLSSTRTTISTTTAATRTATTGAVRTVRAKCDSSATASWPSAAATTDSSINIRPTHPTSSIKSSAHSFSNSWPASPTPPSVTSMTTSTSQLSIEVPIHSSIVIVNCQWPFITGVV